MVKGQREPEIKIYFYSVTLKRLPLKGSEDLCNLCLHYMLNKRDNVYVRLTCILAKKWGYLSKNWECKNRDSEVMLNNWYNVLTFNLLKLL